MNETQQAVLMPSSNAQADETANNVQLDVGPTTTAQNRSQSLASCRGCDTRWTGTSRCHCSGCHESFSGLALFDAHRRDVNGVGTCLDPATITVQPTAIKGQPRPKPTTDGPRLMWLTDRVWQGVENPQPRGEQLAQWRAKAADHA